MLPERIEEVVQESCYLDRKSPVVVAVSGGADSLCLLHVLHSLGYVVQVAHFNHQLRPASAQDAAQLAQFCHRLGVPFFLGTADVGVYARQHALSIEEAARTLRYRFLFSIARENGAQAVTAGHTADDQVETVLMHLLRGSGLSGLKGMQSRLVLPEWDSEIPLVRPLLQVWRSETEAYCREQSLNYITDESNRDVTFFRNRLRLELIPELERYIPGLKGRLWQTADLLSGDHQLIEGLTDDAWNRVCRYQHADRIGLDAPLLQTFEKALQRRLIRRCAFLLVPGLRNLDYTDVERALRFLEKPSASHQIEWLAGLTWRIEQAELILSLPGVQLFLDNIPQIDPDRLDALPIPGQILLNSGWSISANWQTIEQVPGEPAHASPEHTWLDADELPAGKLVIRTRRPGDRFQPLGMESGSLKISDFFINEKIPRECRAAWPMVLSGEVIIWIPGLRPAHTCRLTAATKRVLHLQITHPME